MKMKLGTKVLKSMATLSIATLLLTACGADDNEASEDTGNSEESNELSLAVWNYNGNPEFQGLVEGFEDKNPDVEITVLDLEADAYEDKLTTMFSSKDKTDLMAMKDIPSYSNYADKGQLEDLSDVIERFDDSEIANFQDNLDSYELDGTNYAMPFRKDLYLLFYNKDIFDEQGVDYPENLTWDEYESLAKEMTHEKDGKTVYGTYHHAWPTIMMTTAAVQSDESQVNENYDWTEDYFERWMRMEDEGTTQEYSSIKAANLHYSSEFETEQTAMMPIGNFYVGQLIDRADEHGINWGVTSLPQNDADTVITHGGPTAIALSKYSENKELAKEFLEFASGPEGAKIVASLGFSPAYQTEEIMDSLLNIDGMPQDEETKRAFNPDVNGVEFYPGPNVAEVHQTIKEEYDLIMTGEIGIQEGIEKLSERVSKIIN